MKRFRWLSVAILFIIVSSLLPLAFSSAALADSGKINLQDLTNGADSVLVGTVTERNSYWNDAHTNIYTSVVMSVDDKLKGTLNQDKVTITVEGGEVEGIGEFVSEMPSFDQGEKAMVFLKKLNNAQLPQAMSLPGELPAQQFEVYQGFRGKFPIKGDRAGGLPVAEFKGRINSILAGQALPATELDISPSLVTMPYSVLPYSWPHPPAPVVPYRINENASSCTGEGAAVRSAAATWSSAGANFSFSYAGTTAALGPANDGVNEIMWANLGNVSTLAVTYIWYSGNTITETDTEFNDYYLWNTAPTCPSNYYDVQSIGLHELGHWTGLADLYGYGDTAKVMYGYGYSGTTKRALTADDIAGIQSIYGTSASSNTQKLIGAEASATPDTPNAGNYFILSRFTATASGDMTELRVWCYSQGNVKVAVYADYNGEPGNLLPNAFTNSTPVSAGWNTIPFPSASITSGTNYWLAFCSDGNFVGARNATGYRRYKPATFSSFTFPSNAGTGFTTNTAYYDLTAGWGIVIPATPPNPPDLLSPGAAITFKWGAPSGATKYQLQVSTSSSFTTTVFDTDVGNNTSQEVTGLSLATLYYWHVRAGNDGGWGNWSTTRSVTVNQVP